MVRGCMEARWPWGVVVWGQDGHGEWLYGGKMVMVSGCMEIRLPL